jgi:stage V sporulation protein SpoVS
MPLLRISTRTNLYITTRAIVGMIHRHKHAEVQAIGRAAVKQAEYTIARATAFLEEEGIDIVTKTWNIVSGQDGNEKEGVRFIIRTTR